MKNYIEKAVDAFAESLNNGRTYHWIVLPLGAGATNLAFEIVKKVGKKTLIIAGDNLYSKFNVERHANEYLKEVGKIAKMDNCPNARTGCIEQRGVLTLSAMPDCNSATQAEIIIAEQKHFQLGQFWDIVEMCDLVIYLNCEQCLEIDDTKEVFSRLKEKCSIIMGITSVQDPRIGLTFGNNPISAHFGELPTYEISLCEVASYFKDSDVEPSVIRKAIEEVVLDYVDGTWNGITESTTFSYQSGSGPKDLVDKLERAFIQFMNRSK